MRSPATGRVHDGGGRDFPEWVELWAGRGYPAIAMDPAGRRPDGERIPDGGPDPTDAEKFAAIEHGDTMQQTWTYRAVANVIRAHCLLRKLPEVDPDRIGITGILWGGYLTCIAAGGGHRFRAAVPVYGCGFLHENGDWAETFARMAPPSTDGRIDSSGPSRHLPCCRAPILFVNGTNDFAYPLDSSRRSYRIVRSAQTQCITVNMPHDHPAGWAPKEIGILIDSVLDGRRPLAHLGAVRRRGNAVRLCFTATVPVREAALHHTTDKGPWLEGSDVVLATRAAAQGPRHRRNAEGPWHHRVPEARQCPRRCGACRALVETLRADGQRHRPSKLTGP